MVNPVAQPAPVLHQVVSVPTVPTDADVKKEKEEKEEETSSVEKSAEESSAEDEVEQDLDENSGGFCGMFLHGLTSISDTIRSIPLSCFSGVSAHVSKHFNPHTSGKPIATIEDAFKKHHDQAFAAKIQAAGKIATSAEASVNQAPAAVVVAADGAVEDFNSGSAFEISMDPAGVSSALTEAINNDGSAVLNVPLEQFGGPTDKYGTPTGERMSVQINGKKVSDPTKAAIGVVGSGKTGTYGTPPPGQSGQPKSD